MRRIVVLLLAMALPASIRAAALPGFTVETIVPSINGFLTSLAFDSSDRLFFSVMDGGIYRVDPGGPVLAAKVPTASIGNAANLGIAFSGLDRVVVHTTLPDLTAEVISEVNTDTGAIREIVRLLCQGGLPCSTEHHGGNPIVAPDGTIYVGLGDMGGESAAQNPLSNAGKIFRITPAGDAQVYAMGLRNPYDLAWHPDGYLIASDNGPVGNDEINVVHDGDNLGWPWTMGTDPSVEGTVPPIYTFKNTTAPTGIALVHRTAYLAERGLLVTSFVGTALYYFPSLDVRPLPDPIAIFSGTLGPLIDVAQNSKGEIYFASGGRIVHLRFPNPGDADGNGSVDSADLDAIAREILDGDGNQAIRAQEGSFAGSWGADANGDGVIDSRDLIAVAKKISPAKSRAVAR